MPTDVQRVKGSEITESTGQTTGMIRKGAIVNLCDNLCASIMIATPHSSSAVHHHGEQNTVVYCVRGKGAVHTKPDGPDGELKKTALAPGDFALIPAWCEHQEVNEGDEEVEWIITRSGSSPVVVNLEGWGGREVSD